NSFAGKAFQQGIPQNGVRSSIRNGWSNARHENTETLPFDVCLNDSHQLVCSVRTIVDTAYGARTIVRSTLGPTASAACPHSKKRSNVTASGTSHGRAPWCRSAFRNHNNWLPDSDPYRDRDNFWWLEDNSSLYNARGLQSGWQR